MIDDTILRLKNHLRFQGLKEEDVEIIAQQAFEEIDSQMRNIVANSLESVKSAAEDKEAWEFLEEVNVAANSVVPEITTDSGKLDFSTDVVPMRDKILAKGKTGRDGTIYARIKKGSSKGESKTIKDVDSGADNIRKAKSMTNATVEIAQAFGLTGKKTQITRQPSQGGEWATVTSNQPLDWWAKRAKDMNLTSTIDNANHDIRQQVSNVCEEIFRQYSNRYMR